MCKSANEGTRCEHKTPAQIKDEQKSGIYRDKKGIVFQRATLKQIETKSKRLGLGNPFKKMTAEQAEERLRKLQKDYKDTEYGKNPTWYHPLPVRKVDEVSIKDTLEAIREKQL